MKKYLLNQVTSNQKDCDFYENNNNSVKTLGLKWNLKEDSFHFNTIFSLDISTKRTVLSKRTSLSTFIINYNFSLTIFIQSVIIRLIIESRIKNIKKYL